MCIGFPDVVLYEERLAAARRRRGKARMVEFERRGLPHAPHEGVDERAVAGREPVDRRPRDLLFRGQRLQSVDLFVQIHDEQVDAVARSRPARGQGGDGLALDHVPFEPRQFAEEPFLAVSEVLRRRVVLFFDESDRRQHRVERFRQNGDQVRRFRNVINAGPERLAARDDPVESHFADAASLALFAQGSGVGAGAVRIGSAQLQEREDVFGVLVGEDRGAEQRREKEGLLTQEIEDARLRHVGSLAER